MIQAAGMDAFLSHVSRSLESVGVDYAVVGSVASSFHGEPRMTRDIDVIARIFRSDIPKLAAQFPEDEFYFDRDMVRDSVVSRQPFNIVDLRSMWKADIILPSEPYAHEELARRQRVELVGVSLYVTTAEDTVVSKMRWSKRTESGRQLEDAAGVVRVRGASLDHGMIAALVARFDLAREWARVLDLAA